MNQAPAALPGIIAPPPRLYLGAFALACLLQAVYPLMIMASASVLRAFAVLLLVASAALARWAFVTLRQAGASANPRKPALALTTRGPFRLSRNPIYVAMTGLYGAAGLLLNAWWPLLLLPPLLALMHWGVVLREERHLSAQFGDAYAAYQASVRRWL